MKSKFLIIWKNHYFGGIKMINIWNVVTVMLAGYKMADVEDMATAICKVAKIWDTD